MPIDLDPERLVRSPFAAGLAGALVALRYVPGASWGERLSNVAAGALTAYFGTPALMAWLHPSSTDIGNAIAFAVGLFGVSIAAACFDVLRRLPLADIAAGWLRRPGDRP